MSQELDPDTATAALEQRLELIREVKHEISNAVMALVGYTDLLWDQPELSDNSRRKVNQIREHGKRLQSYTSELGRICRGEPGTGPI